MNNTKKQPTCSQCGSPLVLLNSVTEYIAGSRFPQTTTTYRCTNAVCQAAKDREEEKRIKLVAEKELKNKMRLEEKQRRKDVDKK